MNSRGGKVEQGGEVGKNREEKTRRGKRKDKKTKW